MGDKGGKKDKDKSKKQISKKHEQKVKKAKDKQPKKTSQPLKTLTSTGKGMLTLVSYKKSVNSDNTHEVLHAGDTGIQSERAFQL